MLYRILNCSLVSRKGRGTGLKRMSHAVEEGKPCESPVRVLESGYLKRPMDGDGDICAVIVLNWTLPKISERILQRGR